jgi:hypothetical protein
MTKLTHAQERFTNSFGLISAVNVLDISQGSALNMVNIVFKLSNTRKSVMGYLEGAGQVVKAMGEGDNVNQMRARACQALGRHMQSPAFRTALLDAYRLPMNYDLFASLLQSIETDNPDWLHTVRARKDIFFVNEVLRFGLTPEPLRF